MPSCQMVLSMNSLDSYYAKPSSFYRFSIRVAIASECILIKRLLPGIKTTFGAWEQRYLGCLSLNIQETRIFVFRVSLLLFLIHLLTGMYAGFNK